MTDRTVKQRMAARRERMHATGFMRIEEWVHREDVKRLRKFAEDLRKARAAQG